MYLSVPINMFIWNCQWEMLWFITAWVPLEWNKHSSTTEWLQGCSCPSLTYFSLPYFTDKLSDRSENYLFQLYFIATYNSTLVYEIFFFKVSSNWSDWKRLPLKFYESSNKYLCILFWKLKCGDAIQPGFFLSPHLLGVLILQSVQDDLL